jgi:hypothetical protein
MERWNIAIINIILNSRRIEGNEEGRQFKGSSFIDLNTGRKNQDEKGDRSDLRKSGVVKIGLDSSEKG